MRYREGIKAGDLVCIRSDAGTIEARVHSDDRLRPGVVSINHGWGGLPGDKDGPEAGVSVSLLISTDRDYDPITAVPRMSAIPVNVDLVGCA